MRVDLVLKFDSNLCGVVKWILLFCCVCFPEIPVAGESRSSLIVITGEVKDADGEPLPGVTVVLKGTSLGCVTGTDGKFRLEIPEQKEIVLLFRFVGMKNQEVTVTGARHIRVTMVKDMKELDDDRDRVLHAGEECFYRGDYPDQGRGFVTGVPDESVTGIGNLDTGIEDCRE